MNSDQKSPGSGFESGPISPPVCYHRSPEDILYLSNGVIGLAIGMDPLQESACLVNGFSKPHPESGFETQAFVPYPLGVRFTFGGSPYPTPYRFVVESWKVDFANGELEARGKIEMSDRSFSCILTLWCSRSLPNIVVQQLEFEDVAEAHSCINMEGVAGERIAGGDQSVHWLAPGGDRVGIATATQSAPGCWSQIAAVVPAAMHPRPDLQARRILHIAQTRGVDRLREENHRAWKDLWSHRIAAPYPDGQAAVDAAFYYLNTSIHPASSNSTGLCGMCPPVAYHNFYHHLFWDLEMHALPTLLHTQPEAARAMLEARFRGINRARNNAAMNGYLGLQFPWEAGTKGEEELPLTALKMLFEQHISLCVAEAFAKAADHFGPVFLRERAWPVLAGVAEWIESRVDLDSDGAHIRRVIGISEEMDPHDDNVWTNVLAKRALRHADSAHSRLGFGKHERWGDLAEKIVLPIEQGVLVHSPGFQMRDDFCPEQLMVLFPLQESLAPGLARATLQQTLVPAMKTMGMPMHSPYHWVWGKMAGDEEYSRKAFEQGVLSFVYPPFNMVDEFGSPYADSKKRVGPYIAHCGAILAGALWFNSSGRDSVLS